MKKCSKCGKTLRDDEFYKDSSRKDGLNNKCKKCCAEYRIANKEKIAKYFQDNKVEIYNRRREYQIEYQKKYRSQNKDKISNQNKEYRKKHRDELVSYSREYNSKHKEKLKQQDAEYKIKNSDKIKRRRKKRYDENKEYFSKKKRESYRKHRIEQIEKVKKYDASYAKYDTYGNQLTVDEGAKISKDGISLEVKCKYCGKYCKVTNSDVRKRIASLNGKSLGENGIY